MAKDAQGAHFKAGGKAPTPQPAHVKVPDNPYLAAAQEAQRNQRGVSIICGVLVVIAIAITGVMSTVHAADDEPETSLETPLEMSLGPALLPLDDIARRSAASAEQILWDADPENIRTEAGAALETATSAQGVTTNAPEGFVQTSASAQLDQAIADFESRGYMLGFALVDVETGRSIAYNADEPRYPASSIKAAFCTFVYETNGPVSEGAVKTCIIDSSNEAYHSLIRTYGQQPFSEWLMPMAPNAAGNAAAHFYPWISPNEFLVVWQEIYRYCSSDEPGAAELAGYLGSTTTTAWGELFRGDWEVWAKAGWYPSTAERATCDCGVVFSDCGPYVVVVMSDAPEDFEALKPVLDALNVAHGKMCGGSTDSHLPAA